MKPDEISAHPSASPSLSAPLAGLALLKRATRKMERLRLKGVFTPTKSGPNRKQRRAKRG